MSEVQQVCLVGGPGDGHSLPVEDKINLLSWRPTTPEEEVAARMHGHRAGDRILYVRSKRTLKLFVYQP